MLINSLHARGLCWVPSYPSPHLPYEGIASIMSNLLSTFLNAFVRTNNLPFLLCQFSYTNYAQNFPSLSQRTLILADSRGHLVYLFPQHDIDLQLTSNGAYRASSCCCVGPS
jgi:hypothetical protein